MRNKESVFYEEMDSKDFDIVTEEHDKTSEIKYQIIKEEKFIDQTEYESQRCTVDDCKFPMIKDPGLNKIFIRDMETKKAYNSDGEEKYKEFCKYLGVVPIKSFCECLSKNEIDLWYYGVNPKGIRAMAEALFYNAFVTKLNLEGNQLTCDAVYHLGEMLRENGTICELNLKGCKIGRRGAEALAQGLQTNTCLTLLDLADNALEDEGVKFLIGSFSEHATLIKITLSNNGLTKKSAIRFQQMLEENCILRELDLSWNYLNSDEGCKKLFAGLSKNASLELFNLKWNGLDELAAGPISACLGRNKTLQYFDISNNSFNDQDILVIARGLKRNGSLKQLKIGMNSFSHEGAMGLLGALLEPKPTLEILNFKNVMVEKEFKELLKQVSKVRQVQVQFGGYRSNYVIKGPDVKELLLKRAKFLAQKPKKRPKDFGQFILKLGENPLKKEDFETSVKEAKIKMDTDLMEEIIKAFKIKTGVNTQEMKELYVQLFPDTKLVVKEKGRKVKKGEKEKKETKKGQKEKEAKKGQKEKKETKKGQKEKETKKGQKEKETKKGQKEKKKARKEPKMKKSLKGKK